VIVKDTQKKYIEMLEHNKTSEQSDTRQSYSELWNIIALHKERRERKNKSKKIIKTELKQILCQHRGKKNSILCY
jgi:hypothetical protein